MSEICLLLGFLGAGQGIISFALTKNSAWIGSAIWALAYALRS